MKKIYELLNSGSRFKRSTHLSRDFEDPDALTDYVITPELNNHIQRIGLGTKPTSSLRAWRITGDYGSGKSSFALLVANLLSQATSSLPSKIADLKSSIGLTKKSLPYLPVLVTGSRQPLEGALESALKTAIERRCKKAGRKISKLLSDQNKTLIERLDDVSKAICLNDDFSGVLIIIDELGKFLEHAALHPDEDDIYLLQELGEASSRSGNTPILTLGILHQGFAAYADGLSELRRQEWQKIAGRFEEVSFHQPLFQTAAIVSEALNSGRIPDLQSWAQMSKDLMSETIAQGMYGSQISEKSLVDLAPLLYPLHPTLLPVLAKFFRRFGQNERSLFSFLFSTEPGGLLDFAHKDATKNNIYRISDFYDFAAQNFGHQLSNESFRSHWNHIDAIIRSMHGETAENLAILKTVGLLNVLSAVELYASADIIALSVGAGKTISKSLRNLCKRGLLYDRGSAGYALWSHTNVNLEQAFLNAKENVSRAPPISELAESRIESTPIVGRRHYIKTGTLRHCSVVFLSLEDSLNDKAMRELTSASKADANLFVVLCETKEEMRKARKSAKSYLYDDLFIFITPPMEALAGLALDLERWLWVARNTVELKDDRLAEEEVWRQIQERENSLSIRLNELADYRNRRSQPLSEKNLWFHKGKLHADLQGGLAFQKVLSDHFDLRFTKSPLIKNELINRQQISSSAASGRQKLFKAMLESSHLSLLGLPEDRFPAEKSMYLSVLKASRLHTETEKAWSLSIPKNAKSDPLRVAPVFQHIFDLPEEKPEARVTLSCIQASLTAAPYGVRAGLFPVLICSLLIIHEEEIAVYEDGVFQPDVEEFLFMRLAKRPETFELQLTKISGFRKKLLLEYSAVLESDEATKGQLLGIVKPICLFVEELPDYVRQTSNISEKTAGVRAAVTSATEPGDLIFRVLPKALGFKNQKEISQNTKKISSSLKKALNELRRAYPELLVQIRDEILTAFGDSEAHLENWRQRTALQAETVVLGVTDTELRSFCLKLIDDHLPEEQWLEAMGSFLTRCPPKRWEDKHLEILSKKISELASKFHRVLATCFDEDGTLPDKAVRLAITPRNGEEQDFVLRLDSKKARKALALRDKISKLLIEDEDTSIAALSEALWTLLKNKK